MSGTEIEESGEGLGGGAEEDVVEREGVGGLFGADVYGAGGLLAGDVDEAGGGIDGARGSDDEEDGGAVESGVDAVHVEGDLAEPDDVGADESATVFAGGERRGFVEGAVGEGFVAADAARLE